MRSHRHLAWYYISGGPDRRGSGTTDGDICCVKPSIAVTDGSAEPHTTSGRQGVLRRLGRNRTPDASLFFVQIDAQTDGREARYGMRWTQNIADLYALNQTTNVDASKYLLDAYASRAS